MTLPTSNTFVSTSNSINNNRRGSREPQEEKQDSVPSPLELLEQIGLRASQDLRSSQAMLDESEEIERLGEALGREVNEDLARVAAAAANEELPSDEANDPSAAAAPEDNEEADDDRFDDEQVVVFPSQMECPICMEPPTRPVHFMVPNQDGTHSDQCFEYVEIYRTIYTQLTGQRWFIKHPTNGQFVRRDRAVEYLHDVPEMTQGIIARERARRGLSSEIRCITPDDNIRMVSVQESARA